MSSPAQPWKRFLNLKSGEQGDGDSVHAYGGTSTVAAQESVLFGISERLKAHSTRAVIISATNEEDRYFLTQFLHARNGALRVVVLAATRTFLRGPSSQFTGDMMVDVFPLFTELHDWTGLEKDHESRVFADSMAESTYFSAIDLFRETVHWNPGEENAELSSQDSIWKRRWYPEYSEPNWGQKGWSVQRPPMFVVALGSNATWPLGEISAVPAREKAGDKFRLELPFTLFRRAKELRPGPPMLPPLAEEIEVGLSWQILLVGISLWTAIFCGVFWYANPVSRIAFASYCPTGCSRFWAFKVTIPAGVTACAFAVLAWAVEMPRMVSSEAVAWRHVAEALMVLAPLAVATSALARARANGQLPGKIWIWLAYLPAAAAAGFAVFREIRDAVPLDGQTVEFALNKYREMHWESELSLLPTFMLLLLAVRLWSTQAGSGAALLDEAPPLPHFPENPGISRKEERAITSLGYPLPNWRRARWLWITWLAVAALLTLAHFTFPPFREITSLECHSTTRWLLFIAGAIISMALFDLLQFVFLWNELRGLLRALNREHFKRSFVPIKVFKWTHLWSLSGGSFQDRKAVEAALGECVSELAHRHHHIGFNKDAAGLGELRRRYNAVPLPPVGPAEFRRDRLQYFVHISDAARKAVRIISERRYVEPEPAPSMEREGSQIVLNCSGKGDSGPYADEAEELSRLPEWEQAAERLICLMYIGFIQAIVARLHSLLMSVAFVFSLVLMGVSIYPFVPFSPLMVMGVVVLVAIAWGFFKVFSEMNADPILRRIVREDDRKQEGNFYFKFGEALALPLLAIGSTILPGGTGRLLTLAQTFLNHGQ